MDFEWIKEAETPLSDRFTLFQHDEFDCYGFDSQLHVGDGLICLFFLLDVFKNESRLRFLVPKTTQNGSFYCYESDDLRGRLATEPFLNDFYLETEKNLVMYNSHRDSLCLVFVPHNSIPRQIANQIDEDFRSHLEINGLGFGKAGEIYGNQIIRSLPSERFGDVKARSRLS